MPISKQDIVTGSVQRRRFLLKRVIRLHIDSTAQTPNDPLTSDRYVPERSRIRNGVHFARRQNLRLKGCRTGKNSEAELGRTLQTSDPVTIIRVASMKDHLPRRRPKLYQPIVCQVGRAMPGSVCPA